MASSVNPLIEMRILDELVRGLATEFQFELAGVAPADDGAALYPELEYFPHWVAEGRAGEMAYLERRNEAGELKRGSLQAALPWARSVIVCTASYDSPAPLSIEEAPAGSGWIARYAQTGNKAVVPSDYHDVLLPRLRSMEDALHQRLAPQYGDFNSRSYVDTGPLVERVYARYAGLGWIGKNTCLIHPEKGSWFFLACIVTSLELTGFDLTSALLPDRCGSCTRCIDACPTHALDVPYKMDASRCISYLTIEKRGNIPEEFREDIGRQVFGCDICQDVCPWNARVRKTGDGGDTTADKLLQPRPELVNPPLSWLASLTQDEFRRIFRGSPVERTRRRGLQRNVAIAMGNSGDPEYLPQLKEWAEDEAEPAIADAARWALQHIRRGSSEAGDAANISGNAGPRGDKSGQYWKNES
jgi:epoxyqueuosine reductase